MNNIYLSGLSHSGSPYNRRRAALAGYDLPLLAYPNLIQEVNKVWMKRKKKSKKKLCKKQ